MGEKSSDIICGEEKIHNILSSDEFKEIIKYIGIKIVKKSII